MKFGRISKLLTLTILLMFGSCLIAKLAPAMTNGHLLSDLGNSQRVGFLQAKSVHDPDVVDKNGKETVGMVKLQKNESARAKLLHPLNSAEGTISFWVKPQWSSDSRVSHTLMNAQWGDSRKSYMVISNGWWEPVGTGRLYFILSNEDLAFCSSDRELPNKVWSLVTAVWKAGKDGSCKLFVDDVLLDEEKINISKKMVIEDLEFGTDKATSVAKGRRAEAEFRDLVLLDYSASHAQIMDRYKKEEDDEMIEAKKWMWLPHGVKTFSELKETRRQDLGVFDEGIDWALSKEAIDQRLERIKNAGFNVYIPCVWHGGGARYPSRIGITEKLLSLSISRGWDPLHYLIERAHSMGIKVVPWVTISRSEANIYPEWAGDGVPDGAFDIHNSEFQKFIVSLMMELVNRYDIDGINLDYIRAMGVCLSNRCAEDYRNKFSGHDLFADYKNLGLDVESKDRLGRWQSDAVSDLVRRFSFAAKAVKPNLIISVDANPVFDARQFYSEGRDSILWANNGWIDGVFSMEYGKYIDVEKLHSVERQLKDKNKLWIIIGNYDLIDGVPVPRDGGWVRDALLALDTALPRSATAVYLYNQLSYDQEYYLKNERLIGLYQHRELSK